MKVEAKYYRLVDGSAECALCPHHCRILPGKTGKCRARTFADGKLWATNYGETTSIALDPIEKKPLYHFYPGSQVLSIACNSCNMRCPFCQNWQISQQPAATEYLAPEMLLRAYEQHPCLGVAYTYTEPLMWFEYLHDAMPLIRQHGGKNVLVTNGLIEEAPLRELLGNIDAMNIDLKTMDAAVYRKQLGGDRDTVLRTIELSHEYCHVEITNLIVTGLNDRPAAIDAVIDHVARLDPEIPLHFSRYYPNHRYTRPATSAQVLQYAYEQARSKLRYVYLGNVPGEDGSNTYCPKCGNLLVERMYFQAIIKGLDKDRCARCGTAIAIKIKETENGGTT